MADIWRVWFHGPTFDADVLRADAETRRIASAMRSELEARGIDLDGKHVGRCAAPGPDGTRLPGCVKRYLPGGGHWRMVFKLAELDSGRKVAVFLAHGQHLDDPLGDSAYWRAHHRLNPR